MCAWVLVKLISHGCSDHPHPTGKGQSQLTQTCGEGYDWWGSSSPVRVGQAGDEVGFLSGVSEGQGQLSTALYFNTWLNTWFKWAPVVTWITDINTDPIYIRNMDPDMTSSSSLNSVVTIPQMAVWGSQIKMGQSVAWSPDSSMDPVCHTAFNSNRNHGH